MGMPDHLTCLLRNLYAGQEATVRTGHGTTDWFQVGKGVRQGCILSPCLFNLYAEYIMRNAGLDEAQAGINISRRNINNPRYTNDTTLMAESEEELKSLLKNFLQFVVIHTVKGFGIVNKAEIDVFLELSCFFYDPKGVGNLISGSSAFSKTSLSIWKFLVHLLLKPGLENFEHYFASLWNGYNCAVVWALFGIAFLWDWNEKWPFPVLWPLLSFPNLLAYWVQHFNSIIF